MTAADRDRSPVHRDGDGIGTSDKREALRLKSCAWVVDQVETIFRDSPEEAKRYAERFEKERIDGEVLAYGLTDAELINSLGMAPLGHRRKLLGRIEAWQRDGPPQGLAGVPGGGAGPGGPASIKGPRGTQQDSEAEASLPAATPPQDLPATTQPQAHSNQRTLTLYVRYEFKDQIEFRVKETTDMEKVFTAFCHTMDIDRGAVRFVFDGDRLCESQTPRSLELEDGDVIDAIKEQFGGKPVILLYPKAETACSVTLHLSPKWRLSCVYPKPEGFKGNGCSSASWSIEASPDGWLSARGGKRYPYLFWEALTNAGGVKVAGEGRTVCLDDRHPKSGSMFEFDDRRLESSFCVASAEAGDWLDGALRLLGLNARERTDMVTYWLPQLEANPFSLVHFLDEAEYAEEAALSVKPAPDTVIRVFMIFKRADREGAPSAGCRGLGQLPAAPRARRGFTVVEWGGMNLD